MPQKLIDNQTDNVISPLIDLMMNGLAAFFIILVVSEKVLKSDIEFITERINPVTSDIRPYSFSYSLKNADDKTRFLLLRGEGQLESIGLEFNPSSGHFSGEVTGINEELSIVIEIAAINGKNDTIKKIDTLKVFPLCYPSPNAPLKIAHLDNNLPSGRLNCKYKHILGANGGSGKYIWKAKGLPEGLSINPNNGILEGIPQSSGLFIIDIELENSGVALGENTLSDNLISESFKLSILPEKVDVQLHLPPGRVGNVYKGFLQAENLLPNEEVFWIVADTMNIKQLGAAITGTPMRKGIFPVEAIIKNGSKTIFELLDTLTVLDNRPRPQIGSVVFNVERDTQFDFHIPYQGLTEPVQFFIVDIIPKSFGQIPIIVAKNRIRGHIPYAGTYEIQLEASTPIDNVVYGSIFINVTEPLQQLELLLPINSYCYSGKEFQITPGARGGSGSYFWKLENMSDSMMQVEIDSLTGLITGVIDKPAKNMKLQITLTDNKNIALGKAVSKKFTIQVLENRPDKPHLWILLGVGLTSLLWIGSQILIQNRS